LGGAVKRYEAAAYDERQPAPPRGRHKIYKHKNSVKLIQYND